MGAIQVGLPVAGGSVSGVRQDLGERHAAPKLTDPGMTVTVSCIATSVDRQFTCIGQGSDGSSYTVTATVSSDGQSYIASN